MSWISAFFLSVIIVALAMGFLGAFISGIIGDNAKAYSNMVKILFVIGVICVILLTIAMTKPGDTSSNSGGYSNSDSEDYSDHSCCICGETAYRKYGNDYWCTEHYYMAKASEDDLSP